MSDALATLGTILGETAKRDAIHIAVIPAIAGATLIPGDHVFLKHGEAFESNGLIQGLGIVDPYLTEMVAKGQRFYIFLYPRTITSLRHVWSHPDFPEEAA